MSLKKVLIISAAKDAHIPFVARHLRSKPIIIDAQDVIDGAELSLHFSGKKLTVSYKNADITGVSGVWLRKPSNPEQLKIPVSEQYRKYSGSAILETLNCLYSAFPKARWMSDHYAMLRAENKPTQQAIAATLGFRIPETLYTFSDIKAQRFIGTRGEVAVKSLAYDRPKNDQGQTLIFFTRKVRSGDAVDFSGLRVAPSIFQEMIEVGYEARVTVVKDKVFAARVHLSGQTNENVRDWRLGHFEGDVGFEAYELDPSTHQRCVELTKRLGLSYGAIDLIYDKKGRPWFLEINPNGQWAFIEKTTQQPIGKTIAAYLENSH